MVSTEKTAPRHRVALFVTCLVDLYRPSVGFAAVKLLEDAGCQVEVPTAQTCCGQPAYNSGAKDLTKQIARQVIESFRGYDYVVVPSGSCGGMIRAHYPELFADDPDWRPRAEALAARTYELVSFLHDVLRVTALETRWSGGPITYHDSCSGLRELGVREQPRALLRSIDGVTIAELPSSEVCCGFGGTFCVKYPEISDRMVGDKVANIEQTGAELLLAGDLGCLLNMAGKLKRQGSRIQTRHVAELLAGALDDPAIGEPGTGKAGA
jgi:L-lactate dehydrogenase complex protein LldE